MSKIICDVCGTSYADTADQCPICGTARPAEGSSTDGNEKIEYTHVKGGRFSKGNVRKRNDSSAKEKSESSGAKTGLVIVLVALILVVIAIIAFLVIKFIPQNEAPTEPPTQIVNNPCQAIILPDRDITLENIGDVFILNVQKSPANSTDDLMFESSDPDVVTVTSQGQLEAISEGTAVITITCGEVEIVCQVTVDDGKEIVVLQLNRQEITFTEAGETWIVYSGEIDVEQITWSSDNESVAIVEDGLIIAIGEGQTTIHAEYEGTTVSCPVICKFATEEPTISGGITEDTGGITEDAGGIGEDSGGSDEAVGGVGEDSGNATEIKLYTTYGSAPFNSYINSYDVTIKVGERLSFYLKDNGATLTDVTWSLPAGTTCCWIGDKASNTDNVIKGLTAGNVYLTGTYGGQTFKCYIRVTN